MSAFNDSYVLRVLLVSPKSICGPEAIAEGWRRLKPNLFDAYRPELHYMRGPGPKWRAKHALAARRLEPPLA